VKSKHLIVVCLLVVLCGGVGYAASLGDRFGAESQPSSAIDENTPIEVDADSLDYDKANGRITANGNVVVICGVDELHADRVLVNMNTGETYALGHVVLKRGGKTTEGTKLQYNFRTRVCSLDDPDVDAAPFRVKAAKVTQLARNEYVLESAKITTCKYKHPHSHFHIRAKQVTVVPGEYMKSKGAVWYFGRVPCLYIPFWRRNLDPDSGFRFYPGYRSKWGGYLLSSYYHRWTPTLRGEHHLDYRGERGVAFGEDLKWNTENASGKMNLYFLDDQMPIEPDEDPDASDVESQRYRIHLEHAHNYGDRTLLLSQLNYLSDADVLEDFFDRQYRESRQPENYLSLSHRQDAYTLTAHANMRLNDFYSNVNRLPELSLDVMRLQIGRSSFYYEGQTTAAQLEKVWSDNSEDEDYSAMRLDTSHVLYQPRRYFGWLNLVPRAGYRGTYYSATLDRETSGVVSTTASTNEVVAGGITNMVASTVTSTNMETRVFESGAKLRNTFEVGAEVSFKAFKTMDQRGSGLRHVVEPYANYSFLLEPNILPEDLYYFDSVDTLEELHQTLVGVRNKIQTKRKGRPFDLVDVDVFTRLKFNTEGEEEILENLFLDAEFRPTDWLSLDLDAQYDVTESVLEQFNTRFDLEREGFWIARVEHRYRYEDSNLLSGLLTFYPNEKWALNVFGRYEFEESRVEEQGGYIERKLDCMAFRLGGSILPGFTRTDGSVQDDEYRVMLEFWLTAFPELSIRTKQRY
jgi:LPS-assembly protein